MRKKHFFSRPALHRYLPQGQFRIRFFLILTDFFIPTIAVIAGIVAAHLFFCQQVSAIEGRARKVVAGFPAENTGAASSA